MRTVKAVDAGDILLEKSTSIGKDETAGELFDRLAILGGEAICEAISLVESGKAVFTPQNESQATHCSMIKKEDGNIDFSKSAHEIDCFVRGMTPWPSAFTHVFGKTLKVFKVEKEEFSGQLLNGFENGQVVKSNSKEGLIVKVKDGALRLEEIQLEGGKRMSDTAFLLGRNVEVGTKLG